MVLNAVVEGGLYVTLSEQSDTELKGERKQERSDSLFSTGSFAVIFSLFRSGTVGAFHMLELL